MCVSLPASPEKLTETRAYTPAPMRRKTISSDMTNSGYRLARPDGFDRRSVSRKGKLRDSQGVGLNPDESDLSTGSSSMIALPPADSVRSPLVLSTSKVVQFCALRWMTSFDENPVIVASPAPR